MAPKKNAREAASPAAAAAPTSTSTTPTAAASPVQQKALAAKNSSVASWDKVLQNIYSYYMKETPQRTKLIDVFLAFLAVVGALQFLYCILAGNYVRQSTSAVHAELRVTDGPLSLSMPSSPVSQPPWANLC